MVVEVFVLSFIKTLCFLKCSRQWRGPVDSVQQCIFIFSHFPSSGQELFVSSNLERYVFTMVCQQYDVRHIFAEQDLGRNCLFNQGHQNSINQSKTVSAQ